MKTLTNLRNKCTPNWEVRPVLIFGVLLLLLFFTACSKNEATTEDPNAEDPESELTLAQLIANSGDFPVYSEKPTVAEEETGKVSNEDDPQTARRWVCTEKQVDVSGGSAEFPLYNPNANVIWPGNLIQGNTINDGLPTAITVKRGIGTITIDLANATGLATSPPIVIEQGNVNQAKNDIIATSPAERPANFTVEVKRINSQSELAFEMGVSVETISAKVDADFSYNTSQETNSVLVKIKESFYTMSFVTPTGVDEFFDESVTAEDLAPYIGPDNPAAYIKSVTYGRIFYMLYESTSSSEAMSATLKGQYETLGTEADFDSEIDQFNSFDDLSVKVIAYGGSSKTTLQTAGAVINDFTKLKDVLDLLAKAGDIKTGLPLSYEVYSVKDRDTRLASNLATSYTIQSCEFKGTLPDTNYRPLVDVFEDGIGAAFQLKGQTIVVYNKAGDKYAIYTVGGGNAPFKYDVSDQGGPIASSGKTTGPIGAAVRWRDGRIHLFNTDGNSFLKFRYDPTNSNLSTPTGPLGDIELDSDNKPKVFNTNEYYGDATIFVGSFPFDANGIEAAVQYTHSSNETSDQRYFSNGGTDTATLRDRIGDESIGFTPEWLWGDSESIVDYGLTILQDVGAATTVVSGANTRSDIYFNVAGDQMAIKKDGAWSGPFYIN
ncbi:thiol-activated cytolysin family protein [Maribacter arcticus]|nr:thiol-activated cytolysin family protein [Maribacter arcticus]MDA9089526.1 thiol-activated cytolysin family protein [Maribacter arcticus]